MLVFRGFNDIGEAMIEKFEGVGMACWSLSPWNAAAWAREFEFSAKLFHQELCCVHDARYGMHDVRSVRCVVNVHLAVA